MFSDRSKLDAFRRGDRVVLAEVYEACVGDLARLARIGFSFSSGTTRHRFLGYADPADQQDLIQETFVRAFSERARLAYDGLSPYPAYLAAIARNVVIDTFRRRARALTCFDVDIVDRAVDADSEVAHEERMHDRQLEAAVREFRATMNLREQRFVELRYEKALKQEDVAKRMGITRSTVRTLEQRVRRKLYAHLTRQRLVSGAAAVIAALLVRS